MRQATFLNRPVSAAGRRLPSRLPGRHLDCKATIGQKRSFRIGQLLQVDCAQQTTLSQVVS